MNSKLYKLVIGITLYLVGTCILHYVVIPETAPSPDSFPKNGDTIYNHLAGESVRFIKDRYTGDPSRVEIEVELKASGSVPLAHTHADMNEVFTGVLGTTHLMHLGQLHQLEPGESIEISSGQAHLPFNPGPDTAKVRVSMQPIGVFDLCLLNIHRFLASPASQESWVTTQLQLARFAPFCDVYRHDVPIWIQQAGLFFVVPTLRALGFRAWEE